MQESFEGYAQVAAGVWTVSEEHNAGGDEAMGVLNNRIRIRFEFEFEFEFSGIPGPGAPVLHSTVTERPGGVTVGNRLTS
eukprot:gene2132-483_t